MRATKKHMQGSLSSWEMFCLLVFHVWTLAQRGKPASGKSHFTLLWFDSNILAQWRKTSTENMTQQDALCKRYMTHAAADNTITISNLGRVRPNCNFLQQLRGMCSGSSSIQVLLHCHKWTNKWATHIKSPSDSQEPNISTSLFMLQTRMAHFQHGWPQLEKKSWSVRDVTGPVTLTRRR